MHELQVLEERVQHIDYIPPSPELYYQPTGKEIQPKPVGEEDGTIVFQYYPMSAVNYVSRYSILSLMLNKYLCMLATYLCSSANPALEEVGIFCLLVL